MKEGKTMRAQFMLQGKCGFRAGDANLRRYVSNRPTMFTDPSGLDKGIYNRRSRDGETAWVFFTGDFIRTDTRRAGKVEVESGFFRWDIRVPPNAGRLDVDFWFDPKPTCKSKAISFIQVVHEWKVGGRPHYRSDYFKEFSTDLTSGNYLEHDFGDDDPYYGAKWDGKRWKFEGPGMEVGSHSTGLSAHMTDHPGFKNNKRNQESLLLRLETAAVAIDTQEVLAVLKWGLEIPKDDKLPIRLIAGTTGDVDVFVSPDFRSLVEKANAHPRMEHKIAPPNRLNFNCGGTSIILGAKKP